MIFSTFQSLFDSCSGPNPHFPPTLLYNEGWLLRLVLNWFSNHTVVNHPLAFPKDGNWFSEALLPSPFRPRSRGDLLSESRTHADGVIGHLCIGQHGKSDLDLRSDATHFVVCEAKLFSKLSTGVKNATSYDQAARSIACMIEVVRRSKVSASQIHDFGFHVLAPKSQIEGRVFTAALDKTTIQNKIETRMHQYEKEQNPWLNEWFMPLFPKIVIQPISWEEVLSVICDNDPAFGSELQDFYERCLHFN